MLNTNNEKAGDAITEITKAIEAGWKFDNSYSGLPKIFFSPQNPIPVRSPELVMFNTALAESLGLKARGLQGPEGAEVFAGNHIPHGASPLAQAYAGHQFGHFTMLGDGRALLLGEHITPRGERLDIQLKGSGKTPYSRGGDGRASLGPMLREYIISEAMHALGIPTSRSLAVATTGETVYRDSQLPGAILTRVAASHLRVGTFQFAAEWGTVEDLRALADYTIQRHFPGTDTDNPYLLLLREVVEGQAQLIAKWQLVGFIHGVMNTDNMFIAGETLDYGPCAFMDTYDPATVFSSIDLRGRYAYGNQPSIAAWNLARFAETLLPLLHEDHEHAVKLAEEAVSGFVEVFLCNWRAGMRAKLGLFNEEQEDDAIFSGLLSAMQKYKADYTNTFRDLSYDELEGSDLYQSSEFRDWLDLWRARLRRQQQSWDSVQKLMLSSNPALIPRNHRVEEALAAAVEHGDYRVMERLLKVLSNPYAHSPEQEEYSVLPEPSPIPYRTFCGT